MPTVLIAGLFHETHTFLDGSTALADFQILRGSEMLATRGDSSPLGGVLETAAQHGWQVIPAIDYRAQPSAVVEDEVLASFWAELQTSAREALAQPASIDAIYLVLHGAMVTRSCQDVEGELLERLRSIDGLERVPVFGVFDLHANFSARMARHANCLVGYRENPHTDAREAAVRTAELLQRCLSTGAVPQMAWLPTTLVWPPTGTGTASEPMLGLEAQARAIEQQHSQDCWAVSVVAGFSFADTPDTGVSFVAATTSALGEAVDWLAPLKAYAVEHNAKAMLIDPPVDEVLATLKPQPPGLTVLVEPSDNIGGGAPGDATGLLRALVAHGITNAAIAIADPSAVQCLQGQALGSRHRLAIGGRGSRLDLGPLELEVELLALNSGLFELEDKNSHLASMCGDRFDMGPCAVVRHGGLTILLSSIKTPPFDLGQWRSQGIEPSALSVIAVKAAVAHRRAYDGIAARMLWVDTPGPCSSSLALRRG